MQTWINAIMISIVLMNMFLLGTSRLISCIKVVALQGVVIGLLPLFSGESILTTRVLLISFVTIAVKGGLLPWLLQRALRAADVRREVEPYVGYTVSILVGVFMLLISMVISSRLPHPYPLFSTLVVPVAFSTILVGFFIIVSRMKALTQVLGYLVLENGIYMFGSAFLLEQPVLVELGILLDVFVGVFVMGIAIFHISREFDHIDTRKLSQLSDWHAAEHEERR